MQPSRALLAICAVLVGAACDDTQPTTLDALEEGPVLTEADLDVRAPELNREMFVQFTGGGPSEERAAADVADAPRAEEFDVYLSETKTYIRVDDIGDRFEAHGEQRSSGNTARMETTITVRHGLEVIGTQMGVFQKSYWLVFWLTRKHLNWTWVPFYQTCGLTVEAKTDHAAWYTLFGGEGGVAEVLRREHSTAATPFQQPECSDRIEGQAGSTDEYEEVTCYFRVWFDRETGVVIRRDFLHCEGGSGGLQ